MGKDSKISWTTHTWNPWIGCHKVSEGCQNCYMFREQRIYGRDPEDVHRTSARTFTAPHRWRKPAYVFVCSWSDFFIEEGDQWRGLAWEIIDETPWLTYQILTKRPERIRECLPEDWGDGWGNVWLGVSAENQKRAEERIPILLDIPATLHFISCEPLLGPVFLAQWLQCRVHLLRHRDGRDCLAPKRKRSGYIDWVITGGESGPKKRPMDLEWVRTIRDICVWANVPFFHKQHGGNKKIDGEWGGHELDGEYWKQMPKVGEGGKA